MPAEQKTQCPKGHPCPQCSAIEKAEAAAKALAYVRWSADLKPDSKTKFDKFVKLCAKADVEIAKLGVTGVMKKDAKVPSECKDNGAEVATGEKCVTARAKTITSAFKKAGVKCAKPDLKWGAEAAKCTMKVTAPSGGAKGPACGHGHACPKCAAFEGAEAAAKNLKFERWSEKLKPDSEKLLSKFIKLCAAGDVVVKSMTVSGVMKADATVPSECKDNGPQNATGTKCVAARTKTVTDKFAKAGVEVKKIVKKNGEKDASCKFVLE
jgi:hypothetical protein